MWAASAGSIAYCSKKVRQEMDDKKIPLMGVLGAFIFAAQMINFTIPATGSSGHLGGGLLLSILLGPYAAFLTIASVLAVQALFFADGGLLALGCNIFNLGIFPAFIAYPLVYKKIVCSRPTRGRIAIAAMISAVLGLQLGAFAVVLETVVSGISSLPFSTFITLMQPIHLGIGIVEGLVTASVVSFVYKARPEILQCALQATPIGGTSIRTVAVSLLAAATLTGGVLSWFASDHPDGLEWSIQKLTGKTEVDGTKSGLHGVLGTLQEKTSVFPDYSFKKPEVVTGNAPPALTSVSPETASTKGTKANTKDGGRMGTSVSGILGGFITLVLAGIIGFVLKKRRTS
jgi:cobalt/nickel transport system permease protein